MANKNVLLTNSEPVEIIQSINVLDIVKKIGRRSRRLQAVLLNEIELHIDKTAPEYTKLRKLLLDETNNYTRAIIREIFGDIEYLLRH